MAAMLTCAIGSRLETHASSFKHKQLNKATSISVSVIQFFIIIAINVLTRRYANLM